MLKRFVGAPLRGCIGAAALVAVSAGLLGGNAAFAASGSEFSKDPIPMKTDAELPQRTPPLIEIGPRFLGSGNIPRGIELPTGAVWSPALWVFGGARTAVQYFDSGDGPEIQEWASRIDLFANLHLTPTERVVLGVSPLRRNGNFTRYTRKGPDGEGFHSEFNTEVTAFFAEGEFGEIFPDLDPDDRLGLDFGFAVGRQPVFFQEGIMFNDTIDAFAITRDTNMFRNVTPDMRLTALVGWNQIHRNDNRDDKNATVVGLFSETDFRSNTLNVDLAYVFSNKAGGSDLGLFGIASTQRIGKYNTAIWANASWTPDRRTSIANEGILLFGQVSKTLPYSEDVVYLNAFLGIDNYTSAARDPTAGGQVGQLGILYSAVGLGRYGSALSNRANRAYGGALGYQMFFDNQRTQLILEVGGRQSTATDTGALATAARLQFALGDRYLLQFDGFLSAIENGNDGAGLRSEFGVQF